MTSAGKKRQIVPPAEDLSNVEFETSEEVEVVPTFDNMGLRDELMRGIYSYGLLSHLFCKALFLLTEVQCVLYVNSFPPFCFCWQYRLLTSCN